jgi:hypothetical protein
MTTALAPIDPALRKELAEAVRHLERPSFAVRLAEAAGQPVNRVMRFLPAVASRRVNRILTRAMLRCLEVSIDSLEETIEVPPSTMVPKVLTAATGALGGFFGAVALPIELPATTMIMLRSIAEIAHAHGENVRSTETGLACLEVFALGGRRSHDKVDVGYYATRAVLTKLTADMAAFVAERGAIDAAAPIVGRMVGEITQRFGIAVSERVAASAIPVIGAIGGAGVNLIFMNHFQQLAQGHFTVRRLERTHGAATVRGWYNEMAAGDLVRNR